MPEVIYRIEATEDDLPVRGAIASGDEAYDKQVEDEILERLDQGDVWAWARVRVVAKCGGFEGDTYLGGCCYEGEEDFKKDGGYFKQMCDDAKEELLKELGYAVESGETAAALLGTLLSGTADRLLPEPR